VRVNIDSLVTDFHLFLVQEASSAGCGMLFLPECCSFIGENAEEV